MRATANGSVSGTRTPVYFFSVSFDVDHPVDEVMMRRVARRTLRDMGLEEHEAVIVAHKDRSPHLHFVVNRVHPERATLWRKWWDYPRPERSLRAEEVELGLRVVPGRGHAFAGLRSRWEGVPARCPRLAGARGHAGHRYAGSANVRNHEIRHSIRR
jgi:hypothetical protein